eukprot:3155348-Amphidinium_carterae.1
MAQRLCEMLLHLMVNCKAHVLDAVGGLAENSIVTLFQDVTYVFPASRLHTINTHAELIERLWQYVKKTLHYS